MQDIWTAVAIMIFFAVIAALVAARFLSTNKGQWVMLLLTLSIVGAVFFLLYFAGQLFWARIIPHSAAIIYSNLSGIFAAMGAGWACRMPRIPWWRRIGMSLFMAMGALAAILWPLLSMAVRPPPEGQDEWLGPVAMQTSWATCSPAAAATLLTASGIPVSEREMIPLCLTDRDGTPTLGLYRGLKLVASRDKRQVEITDKSFTRLLEENDWPVLAAVRLPFGVDDPRFADEWGWIPGMGHSVVILGRVPTGDFIIADPAIGPELWTESKLETLWQGNGMRVR